MNTCKSGLTGCLQLSCHLDDTCMTVCYIKVEQIATEFKQLAKRFHPDKVEGSDEKKEGTMCK